jgi:hypothetical protein
MTTAPTLVLHIGDHDASGVSIFDAFTDDVIAMIRDYGHEDILEFRRVLVRPEHEAQYRLERGFAKSTDLRGAGICAGTGLPFNPAWDYTIQAEAFSPDNLAAVLRAALESVIDLNILEETKAESERQKEEILEQLREAGIIEEDES